MTTMNTGTDALRVTLLRYQARRRHGSQSGVVRWRCDHGHPHERSLDGRFGRSDGEATVTVALAVITNISRLQNKSPAHSTGDASGLLASVRLGQCHVHFTKCHVLVTIGTPAEFTQSVGWSGRLGPDT